MTTNVDRWIEDETLRMQLAAERQAVEAIKPYYEAQQAAARYKKDQDAYGMAIKAYMSTHGLEELQDAETGYRALLQPRRLPNENWDVSAMPDELVLRLAKAGCLNVDRKAMDLKSHQALRLDAERWFVPAGMTEALRVTRDERA